MWGFFVANPFGERQGYMTTKEQETQEIQETQPFEPTDVVEETVETPEETPDYQALYLEAKAAGEKAEQRAKSLEGNVRSQRERDAAVDRAVQESTKARRYMELLIENQSNPDADPEDFRTRLAEISTEEDRATFESESAELLANINEAIASSGLEADDPRYIEAVTLWNANKDNPRQIMRLVRARDIVNSAALDRAKAAQEAAIRAAREEGVNEGRQRRDRADQTDLGLPRGSGAQRSASETWDAYGRGELSWTPQVQEAGKALGFL
jgi:hypothetical protein